MDTDAKMLHVWSHRMGGRTRQDARDDLVAQPLWKTKPMRDPKYLRHVQGLPCSVPGCNGRQIFAHHVAAGGMGTKCDDSLTVPLCDPFGHHTELHRMGKKTFEKKYGVDLESIAKNNFSAYNAPTLNKRGV